MRNLRLCYIILFLLALNSFVLAGIPAIYDADTGNPHNASAIQNPSLQGWSEFGTGANITVEGVVENSTNAWRIFDNANNNNPRYVQYISAEDFQDMYNNGWEFVAVARAVQGSQFVGWGITQDNDPGWGLTTRERVGFTISYASGAFKVSPIHGDTIVLGAGSAATYHTIRCVGAVKSSQYDFYLDGIFRGTYDIKDGTSNSSNDNLLFFASGSTGGTGREANWNYVGLAAGRLPNRRIIITETDGSTDVVEGGATDQYYIGIRGAIDNPLDITVTPDTQVTVNGSSSPVTLVFMPSSDPNGPPVQAITVAAVDDNENEGPHQGIITHTVVTTDPNFAGAYIPNVIVNITDNDGTPGFTISKTLAQVNEGGDPNDSYSIKLNTPPSAPVTINFGTDAQLRSIASVTFDHSNWTQPQTIPVVAVDDNIAEGTQYSTITHTITTSAAEYASLSLPDVNVVIGDNDAAGPTATIPYAWYKADIGTVSSEGMPVDNDRIIVWQDQSGNLRHLNRVSGQGPLYQVNSAKAGKPDLRFNNGSLWDDVGSWGALANPKTIFAVATVDDAADAYIFDSQTSSGRSALFQWGNAGSWALYAGAVLKTGTPSLIGAPAVHSVLFGLSDTDTVTSAHYFNGKLLASGPAGEKLLKGFMVGSRYTSTSRLHGTISEVIVYDVALSTSERKQVEQYLMSRWLNPVEIYETGNGTTVTEEANNDPNSDDFYVSVIGNHSSLYVTCKPDSELNVDKAGAGVPVVLNFAGSGTSETKMASVAAVDDNISEGPESHTICFTAPGISIRNLLVTINDNEAWCGQPGTVYKSADLNQDCYVDLQDLVILASQWLCCTDPGNPANCTVLP